MAWTSPFNKTTDKKTSTSEAKKAQNALLEDMTKAQEKIKNYITYDEPIGPKQEPTLSSFSSGSSYGNTISSINSSLSQMLAAYDEAANANRGLAQQVYDTSIRNANTAYDRANQTYNTGVSDANRSYETTASNLLRSLERFREENQKNVENQKQAYRSEQASLEDARYEADRQNRISAAARGLGGSGLQQLAQLQNLISQGQAISDLALSNRNTMDKYATQMKEAQEDYDTDLAEATTTRDNTLSTLLTALNNAGVDKENALADALATYQNTLNSINADLATNKANANWTAASQRSSAASANASTLQYLNQIQEDTIEDLKEIGSANKSNLEKLMKNYYGDSYNSKTTKDKFMSDVVSSSLNNALSSGYVLDESQRQTLKSNLNKYLEYYK